MSNEPSTKCPQCGATLPENAPAGLCPSCLMVFLNLKTETVLTDEPSAAQPPLPPEQIAPHFPQLEILECLGRGGMGVVYKARQKSLNRLVALKLLAPERVNDPRFSERFAREAQALAALNHPNIVTIHDFGQAGGFYFLLMEFVDGLNLRQLMRTRTFFAPEEALAIVPAICEALQYAHERGIVHRDIKPENLLLDKQGKVKIADFGIAKMMGNDDGGPSTAMPGNATQSALGTPGYSAPEQKSDPQRADNRMDIYSLGVVFYEMLTGELPGKRIEPPSRKVHIDVRLDAVVLRALEKTPELRWQTAADLRTQVETIASTPAVKTGTVTQNNTNSRDRNSRFWRTAIASAVCLVLVLFLASLYLDFKRNKVRPILFNTNSLAEAWHPDVVPGEKPDLTEIRDGIDDLIRQSNYNEALQHQIWYFDHAREYGEIDPVRLSFGMTGWQQLAGLYPAAHQTLIGIRDRDIQEFKEAASFTSWAEETNNTAPGQVRTRFALFEEIHAINDALGDNDAQTALVHLLIGTDPKLASTMGYKIADDAFDILKKKAANGKAVGDGQAAFDVIRRQWESQRKWEVHMDDVMERARRPVTPPGAPMGPGIHHAANTMFVDQTRELIQILVAHNQEADAERIRLQALALVDDPWLKSAVSDAKTAAQNQSGASTQP